MKKVFLIIGARPNFMKAFPVYEALKDDFELTLIHTGQHFDAKMSDVFFNQLKFPKPDIHLSLEKKTKSGDFDDKLYVNNGEYLKDKDAVIQELMNYDGDLGQLGEIRDKLKMEFEKGKPDLVIVFGDVTSTLAGGLAAKTLNIDLAHVESGLRSRDLKMPEEVNRILTDHISTYYFVTEQSGIDNLKDIGITENVYLVGNTMIDTQKKYLQQALDTKYHETLDVKSKGYVLITLHRPSNVDDMDKLKEIFDDFEELSKTETLVYPIHPRTKNNLEKLGYLQKVQDNPNIILDEPLGYLEFTCLMANCKYVVTDSGGLQEESTALDIPCFTLRENTERPSTLIENHGTNQLIHKISEIELKECKGSMDLWDGKSSMKIKNNLACKMKILLFYNLNNYQVISSFDENNRDIRLYKFNHVHLSGKSSYYPDVLLKERKQTHLILPIYEMTMSLNKKSFYEESGMEFNYYDNIEQIEINQDVYYFIYNTSNYYHFIYDTLPYIYCFLKLRKTNKDIKLLVNYDNNNTKILPFVVECYELLDITKNDIIIHNKNNIYKSMYLSSSLTHNGLSNNPPRKEIFEIYEFIKQNALKDILNYNFNFDKIYISRRTWTNVEKNENIGTDYTTRRKLMNEDNLVCRLSELGFTEFFGERYSMKEKIIILYSSNVVIGSIGGTISNCVFCSDKTKIITMVSPHFLDINYRMKYLFSNNTILINGSLYGDNSKIPDNVRIEITDKSHPNHKMIGEIAGSGTNKNQYRVNLGNNYFTFKHDDTHKQIVLYKKQFITLDNGINSPWNINIDEVISLL